MKFLPPPPMAAFATGEEKCDDLGQFIQDVLDLEGSRSIDIKVIARSAASPVARAIVTHGARLARQNATIQAVFAELGAERTRDGWTLAGPTLPFVSAVRHMAQRCYHDVHEQLIIGNQNVWYGDSLRRDPDKRDALSLFTRDCVMTARMAKRTFDQVWTLSHQLVAMEGHSNSGLLRGSDAATTVAHALADVTPPRTVSVDAGTDDAAADTAQDGGSPRH
jgi:hypothetical protein